MDSLKYESVILIIKPLSCDRNFNLEILVYETVRPNDSLIREHCYFLPLFVPPADTAPVL